MNIMGLHLGHDATCAVIKDNRLVSMVERERLTRVKYDRGMLPAMVDNALDLAGLRFFDIDCMALSLCSGGDKEPKLRPYDMWGITVRKNGKNYINGPRQLDPWECEDGIEVIYDGITKPAYQVQHHIAHAASSFYTSPFDRAIALTYDGSGPPPEQTSLICKCEDTKINVEGVPNLNGALVYGVICRHTYGSFRDSGKLMGLSAYGEPDYYYNHYLDNVTIDALIENLNKYWPPPHIMKESFKRACDISIPKNIAASAQMWFMEDVKRVIAFLENEYGEFNLVTGGGGALNVIANRWIYDKYPLFIPPFPKDDGLAPGAALYVLHHVNNRPREDYTTDEISFLGSYSDTYWDAILPPEMERVRAKKLAELAKELDGGAVVLWHQGRAEVGPRALTHRSIFADPRLRYNKERVSQKIKGREAYRPLAPIVLAEDCEEYFDVAPNPLTEMMLLNARVKKPDEIPAVVHVDGTARVQTITKRFNPVVHCLLKEFKERTGCPVLINTSLNIQGQAICEAGRDTMWTFENCEADVCVIDGKIYRK